MTKEAKIISRNYKFNKWNLKLNRYSKDIYSKDIVKSKLDTPVEIKHNPEEKS